MTNDDRPVNIVQWQHKEIRREYGLNDYPNIPTDKLLTIVRKLVKDIGLKDQRPATNEDLALKVWALDIIDHMLNVRR